MGFWVPVLSCMVEGRPIRSALISSDLGLKKSPNAFPRGIIHPSGNTTDFSLGPSPAPVSVIPSLALVPTAGPWPEKLGPSFILCPQSRPGGKAIVGFTLYFRGPRVGTTVFLCLLRRLVEAALRGSVCPANLRKSVANSWKTRSRK
jgi:hypothetical protein